MCTLVASLEGFVANSFPAQSSPQQIYRVTFSTFSSYWKVVLPMSSVHLLLLTSLFIFDSFRNIYLKALWSGLIFQEMENAYPGKIFVGLLYLMFVADWCIINILFIYYLFIHFGTPTTITSHYNFLSSFPVILVCLIFISI